MKNKRYLGYIIPFCLICLIPFAGMSFWPTNETTENTTLAQWPSWTEDDGSWNQAYLSELGEYFDDHFAFRQNFVTANALLRGKLFQTAATDQVIEGTDDWLYYSGTLEDYQGTNIMSDRELYAAAHNLKLIQEYVEAQGSQFIVTVAPNKNSLYTENMPYYYLAGTEKNLDYFAEALETAGVHYVDLYTRFTEQDEVLYFKRDTHWNNKGAVLAYNALTEAMGIEHETYLNVPYSLETTHSGDLDEMLYPLAVEEEEEYVYDKDWSYSYVNEVTDNMDDWIETINPQKSGTLLMYRDSFGESLLPFMADAVGTGYFSRLVPYNLSQVVQYNPDYVIIERAERNIASFAQSAPIMEPAAVENLTGPEVKTDSTIRTEEQGSWLLIEGEIDETYIEADTEIYVTIRDNMATQITTYPVFYISTDEGDGYQLYLRLDSIPQGNIHINVIAVNNGQSIIVADEDTAI